MVNLTEQLKFTVPLGIHDFQLAKQFSIQQKNPEKAKQVFLNTLAVLAVNFYCQCLEVETDIEQSYSWDSNTQMLMDVADLKIRNLGRLECRPILSEESICYVPPEVWFDRVGYAIVEINEETKTATLLGFVERVEEEEISLSQISPLEELINLLLTRTTLSYSEQIKDSEVEQNFETISQIENLQNLRDKLESLFTKDWDKPEKLLAASHRSINSSQNQQSSNSEIKVSKAKLIRLKEREFVLVIKITLDGDRLNLLLEVRPRVRTITEDINVLPPNLELALLSASGKVVKSKQSGKADDFIRIKCSIPSKKTFGVAVSLEGECHKEKFISN